jgi:putative salt-induced outer membrane protein YdiY
LVAVKSASIARADTIKTANGESLQGTVVQETSDFVLFRSASFGEIKIARTPGMQITRGAIGLADASKSAEPSAPKTAPSGPANEPPAPPSLIKRTLGLSDRWSAEFEANLLIQNDKFHASSRGSELTIGYKVPNETKPDQTLHEYGLFASYNYDKVNDTVVGENSEIAFRYFYRPISPWLLVSQADWMRDRINGIDSRSHVIAVPAYRMIDTKTTRLLAGIGPSFLSDSQIVSNGPTVLHTERGFRLAFYQLLQQTLSPGLTFRQTLLVLSRPKDPADTYNLRFDASLRRMLTPHVSINLIYDYVRNDDEYILPANSPFSSAAIATLKLTLGYRL